MNQQPVIPHEAPCYGSDHLPVRPPEELFGRQSDLSTIHLSLKAGTAVLLHGPAGIGKTALGASLASGYAELPGGVLWLEVNNDSTLSLMARVARAYAAGVLADNPDREAVEQAVSDLLHRNRPLIVLDGHVRVEAAREFIRECAPGIPLLLTHPQLAAGSWTPHAVNPLPPDEARAMLCNLSGLLPDAEGVDSLSEALGGHALSIFVAAHQLKSGQVPPGEFLTQMPAMPPGEANRIMGVLMASYRLLPKELQGLVLLLATVFAGGASEELLADASGAPAEAIRGRMRQLVERGFVSERAVYGQPYFSTHELVQVFARTFLRGKKQLEPMQARHLKALAAYIRRHLPAQHDRLAAEMSNVLAGAVFAAENGQIEDLNEIISLLETGDFAEVRAFRAEVSWLRQLAAQPKLAQTGILGALVEERPEPAIPPRAEAQPLGESPRAEAAEAGIPPAEALFAEPVIQRTSEMTEPPSGPPAAPEPTAKTAVALPTDAESLVQIGRQAVQQGETAAAITQYTQALEGYQADGNVADELAAIEALAMLSLESENYEAVLAYVDQGMTLAQDSDSPQREGELLVILGDLQVTLGRWDGAELAYKEAVNALRSTEAWLDIGLTLDKLGVLYLEQERYEEAFAAWNQALPIFERAGRSDLLRTVHSRSGDAYAEMMQWDQAQAQYSHALELAQAEQNDQASFEQLHNLGALMEASGRRDEAQTFYRSALHFAFRLGEPDKIREQLGQTLLALARLLIDDTTQLNRAIQVLESAEENLPADTAIQRLLARTRTRQNRLLQAGVTLPLAEDSLQNYARMAAQGTSE
jgi:tetratricopeptide (TPR) repeat protein